MQMSDLLVSEGYAAVGYEYVSVIIYDFVLFPFKK